MAATAHLSTQSDSRRAMQRSRCAFAATISFAGVNLCSCIIKDISLAGARLLVPGNAWLPGEFEIVSEVFDTPVRARRVWTNKEHVGVKFTGN